MPKLCPKINEMYKKDLTGLITLPIAIKYKDDIELLEKLLNIYSVTVKRLTKRNIDLISLCILHGINNKDLRQIGIDSGIFNNPEQVNTEFSRLKSRGFINKHPVYNEKALSGGLEVIEKLFHKRKLKKGIGLYLQYERV